MKISVRDLEVSFGDLRVLDGVSFDVAPGEFVSILGPSGSGKSTLFQVLAGLLEPDAGRVEAASSAYMPQKDLLFPWRTVLDNTTLGLEVAGMPRRAARAKAGALFEPFGLSGFEHSRPDELSGGMRQRAALLRTVVQDRDVLLLDEPFGALDSLTRTAMQEWLDEMRARFGWTVLLITHDVREAVYLSDRVLVLSPRPARVVHERPIDLPHPREVTAAAAVEVELRGALR
ncbi:ABC transporter ATP-binding protein [Pseudonocardia sp. WMMC193]|uniref:ABC transporter ATP-binding protein n=1 Tax=Pseudonocardia sp. WMMC193 TaxID=2911965 RepID=UPI001F2246F4|nr:ABC transporter ATP-binding protein [Pseudonocardia sp. WMMC193]MCF7549735.1 ABC transporter ATP-binding protein [Pseudonocardia sp. WMMC193]